VFDLPARIRALVRRIAAQLPKLTVLVCLDAELEGVPSFEAWLALRG